MFTQQDDNNELDPIAFLALLLLSGGQKFTFHDLAKSMNRPSEVVWDAVQTLQNKNFINSETSHFMIDSLGAEYLITRGILATEAEDEPESKDFKKNLDRPSSPHGKICSHGLERHLSSRWQW